MANSGSVGVNAPPTPPLYDFFLSKKKPILQQYRLGVYNLKRDYFFLAFGFGMSVMLPSNISAARPIDSFNVG